MYIIVCQTFNIHTILIFTKYFYLFYIELRLIIFLNKNCLLEAKYEWFELLKKNEGKIQFSEDLEI